MTSTALCLVRHGETDYNRLGILQGWLDIALNEKGRQQGLVMAKTLQPHGFDVLWSSPLQRASETAQQLACVLGLRPPNVHDGLRERNFGAIQGIPKAELAQTNPIMLEQILRRNPAAVFTGGESMDEFADRVLAALADIATEHPAQRVLVVTHGWVLDVAARHVQGLPRRAVLPNKPKNGDQQWLLRRQGGWYPHAPLPS